jgi:IS30 family transposase
VTSASLVLQKLGIREMAGVLNRSPSTISREVRRNLGAQDCASDPARQQCFQRRKATRSAIKLHANAVLVRAGCSDIGPHLPQRPNSLQWWRRVSHETIYNCIYAQPVGQLKRELIACMRQAHNKHVPGSKVQDRRGQIPETLSIHPHPPETEDRQFPRHWEGDLIKGAANASVVGTLVEHTSRLVMLLKLPEYKPASAANVMQAFTDKLMIIAQPSPCA